VRLGRDDAVAHLLVTAPPDVAVSTNLGGWINAMGMYSAEETELFSTGNRPLSWRPGTGRSAHRTGISEINLFMLLDQLGITHEREWDRCTGSRSGLSVSTGSANRGRFGMCIAALGLWRTRS